MKAPKILKALYRGWMKFAHLIGKVNTAILLTIFYYTIMGLARLVTLLGRRDLLDQRLGDRPSYWKTRTNFKASPEAFLKPY